MVVLRSLFVSASAIFLFSFGTPGCNSASMQSLTDTAYDVAEAERFGRMDLVTSHVTPARRDDFADAHADWGDDIRIVDLEYGGLRQPDAKHADVTLTIAWQRVDDPTLRTTVVKQHWLHTDNWFITGETRFKGDRGLVEDEEKHLDEKTVTDDPKPDASGHKKEHAHRDSAPAASDLVSDAVATPAH